MALTASALAAAAAIRTKGNAMASREELARATFAKSFNCAQSVLSSFGDMYDLDRSTALQLANGFGGGLRTGELCGALTGGVMVIGLLCGFNVEGDMERKAFCNQKAYEFVQKFRAENGSVLCRELLDFDIRKPEDFEEPKVKLGHETVCPDVIGAAVRMLESMSFQI